MKMPLILLGILFSYAVNAQSFTVQTGEITDPCPGMCNGTVMLEGSGGTPPFVAVLNDLNDPNFNVLCNTYTDSTWFFYGLCPGNYVASISDDNGQVAYDTFEIYTPTLDAIVTSNYNGYGVSCYGMNDGSATAVYYLTNMNNFLGVSWSNGAFTDDIYNLSAASYFADVSYMAWDYSQGSPMLITCTMADFVDITEPDSLLVSGVPANELFGNDGSIDLTVSGGVTNYSYNWTGPNNYTSSTEDQSGLSAGTYNVIVTDANNCASTQSYVVDSEVALEETDIDKNIVFPNPFVDQLIIDTEDPSSVSVFNGAGQLVYENLYINGTTTIDASFFEPGMYTIILTSGNAQSFRKLYKL